jgi:hypothetical protein
MIENNRTALGLMSVLMVVVLGFGWWQFLYKPASTEHSAAVLANQTAQSALSQAQSNLQKAQQEVDAAKRENGGKFDTSIAKVQVAREAVPNKARIDDALLVLAKLANRSGIRTNWNLESAGDAASTASAGTVGDATAMEVNVDAVGKWSQLKTFISLVESSASSERGQLHVRGRLFNVVKIHAGSADSQSSAAADGQSATDDTLQLKAGEYHYKITIAMYTSNFGAAAGATGAGATSGAGGATTTDPNAAAGVGAAGTTPSTSATTTPGSSTTSGTTPGSTSTTPSSTGATSPTGSGSTAGMPTTGTGATSTTGVTP